MSVLSSFDLSGKTALVSSCKRGIGFAMAEASNVSEHEDEPWADEVTGECFSSWVGDGGGLFVVHSGSSGYDATPAMQKLMAGAFESHPPQCSVADGESRAYLRIPDDCEQVRGVVVANHNMAEQGILEHPIMRETLAFLATVPADNSKASLWTGLPAGSPLGHADSGEAIKLARIVGPAIQTGPDTFRLHFGRAECPANRRNNDIWIVASHPGDAQYRGIVQQAMVHVAPNNEGAPQKIDFPEIPDQKQGVKSLKLPATSDSGAPVSYYVREGPAKAEGNTLIFTGIPPRAKFPIKVTILAWQGAVRPSRNSRPRSALSARFSSLAHRPLSRKS